MSERQREKLRKTLLKDRWFLVSWKDQKQEVFYDVLKASDVQPATQLSEEVDVLDLRVGHECYGLYNGEQYPACVEGVGKHASVLLSILN